MWRRRCCRRTRRCWACPTRNNEIGHRHFIGHTRVFRGPELGWALDVAAAVLPAYEALLGVPYPLPKLDLTALPDFAAGAMENWGLVVYRETALLAGNTSGIQQRREVALTIAHELAHMVGSLSAGPGCMASLSVGEALSDTGTAQVQCHLHK